jgi:L-ascorbate metabolism protein UlaG (beta-lactamase superfamily)
LGVNKALQRLFDLLSMETSCDNILRPMDITWLGQACFKVKGKQASIVLDPYTDQIGFRLPKVEADIVTVSHDHYDHNAASEVGGDPFVITGPGEYEIKGVNVAGVSSFHDNNKGAERGKNILFSVHIDNVKVAHLGDLGQNELTLAQVEALGNVDILMIPVGAVYTIDAATAAKIVSSLEPLIIIPMHYQDKESKVDLEPVEKFLKEMGREEVETVKKLTISKDRLPTEPQIVLLEKG